MALTERRYIFLSRFADEAETVPLNGSEIALTLRVQ